MKKNKHLHKKNTIISIEIKNKRREEAQALQRARRTNRLKKAGVTDEQMKQLIEDKDARSILCIYYGKYTCNLGEQEVTEKVYNKKSKEMKEVTRKREIILRGSKAAEHYITEKKYDVLKFTPTCCYIKATKDTAEEIANDLRETIGRCSITKHDNLTVAEVIEKFHPKTEKKAEIKKIAKKKGKTKKKKHKEMRPYYTALRDGGVNARIKKYNPTLAKKIENWIKEHKISEKSKQKDKEYRAERFQLTSLEMKNNKKVRKVKKREATLLRMKTVQKVKAEENLKKKKHSSAQQKLKMAA